jgi:hypothetical protein
MKLYSMIAGYVNKRQGIPKKQYNKMDNPEKLEA